MRRPISPTMHGVIDYATVAATAAVPRLLRFPKQAEQLCYTLAGGYGGLSSMTDYPLAVKRAVPFKMHGAAEAAIGVALPFMPWALGFAKHRRARNFFLGLTAMTAVVAALTDWSAKR